MIFREVKLKHNYLNCLSAGYTASVAAQPVAYAAAPLAGVYAGVDPSVAYANLCTFTLGIIKRSFIHSDDFNRPRCRALRPRGDRR